MSKDGERGVSGMELERDALDTVFNGLQDAALYRREQQQPNEWVHPLNMIGNMTAKLINRGHPAGYVVTSEGTFMVTVEMVSRAILDTPATLTP